MKYKPFVWPLKEIIKNPSGFLKSIRTDYHLIQGIKNQDRANKHNLTAGILLGIIKPGDPGLPPDDQLWLVIVATPVPEQHQENLAEWHLWSVANSAPLNDILSKLPGRVIFMKSIAQIRGEILAGMKRPIVSDYSWVPVEGKKEWIQ